MASQETFHPGDALPGGTKPTALCLLQSAIDCNPLHPMLSHIRLFVSQWTVAHQVPLSIEFFRQKYWNGLLFPSLGHITVEAGKYKLYVSGWYLETQAGFLCHSLTSNFFPTSVFVGNIFT